jgi:MIP family channel proteins
MAVEQGATRSTGLGLEELSSPETLKASLAELIATAIFVLVGVGSFAVAAAGGGVVGIAFAHGLAFALLVAAIGGISGGHINPAVTFGMIITGQIAVMRGVMYIVAQLIGACIGTLLLRAFILDDILRELGGGGGHAMNTAVVSETWHGMFLEALGAFVLVWTIFAVAVNPRTRSGIAAPLYIGSAVLVIHLFLVPLTGSGINPARTFGPALFLPSAADGIPGRWSDAWIYYVGPLLGAAAAALSYYLLYLMPPRSTQS